MASTVHLGLPLLAASQAQKHVTVNEALAILDAAAQLHVSSSVVATPPTSAAEGTSFLLPAAANGDWAGKSGNIAVWSNGGWIFLTPRSGWRVWDASRQGWHFFDGTAWIADAVVASQHGAGMIWKVIEFDHVIAPGASNPTLIVIPSHTQVVGITGRVLNALSGSGLTSWRVGVVGADNRYGMGLGLARNSYVVGLSGSPVTYFADTPLLLTAEGGVFASGSVRLALNVVQLTPPRA